MTKAAFERDNVLSADDRLASARKCLSVLASAGPEDFRMADYNFLTGQRKRSEYTDWQVSERQLAWLRDLVEKYV